MVDRCWVRTKRRTHTPTIARVGVRVYHLPTMEYLPATRDGQASDGVFLPPVKVEAWEPHEYEIPYALSVNLGDKIDLVGYELDGWEARTGDTKHLTLFWRSGGEMVDDYTVFTHLIDSAGRVWSQDDGYPLRGDYPTSFWAAKEVVRDQYELVVPAGIPAGEYELEVGLYLATSGERLPVLDDIGQVLDNRVVLGRVAVTD